MFLTIRTTKKDNEIRRREKRAAWQAGFDQAIACRGIAESYLDFSRSWCAAGNSIIDQCNNILTKYESLDEEKSDD